MTHDDVDKVRDARNLLRDVRQSEDDRFMRHSLLWKCLESAILSTEAAWKILEDEVYPDEG
jgi:hypothetical protein